MVSSGLTKTLTGRAASSIQRCWRCQSSMLAVLDGFLASFSLSTSLITSPSQGTSMREGRCRKFIRDCWEGGDQIWQGQGFKFSTPICMVLRGNQKVWPSRNANPMPSNQQDDQKLGILRFSFFQQWRVFCGRFCHILRDGNHQRDELPGGLTSQCQVKGPISIISTYNNQHKNQHKCQH